MHRVLPEFAVPSGEELETEPISRAASEILFIFSFATVVNTVHGRQAKELQFSTGELNVRTKLV